MAGLPITTLEEEATEALRMELRGPLLMSGDPGYDQARRVNNALIDRRPALVVCCAGPADVVAAVIFARQHNLLVSVRGGGHNVAGSAIADGDLVIDLSQMRGVRVDPATRTARVAGGAPGAMLIGRHNLCLMCRLKITAARCLF